MGCYNDDPVYGLVRDLFLAGSISCALLALHRLAQGVLLESRIKAYKKFEDAYTPEEREVLIHRIKVDSLSH